MSFKLSFKHVEETLKTLPSTALLLAISGWPSLAQEAPASDAVRLAFECREVAAAASAYLDEHGMENHEESSLPGLSIGGGKKPWIDAQGNKLSDLRVYWKYANSKNTDKSPFASWRLRLSHYHPIGDMKLIPEEGACTVDFRLRFYTSGADVVALIIPLDSMWSYGSNGRLEREYLNGISEALNLAKLTGPKP